MASELGAPPTRSNYVRLEEVLGNSLHPFEAGHPDLHDDLHALRGRCALELGPRRHVRFLLIPAFRVHGVVRRLVPLAEYFVAARALPVNALAVVIGVDNSLTEERGVSVCATDRGRTDTAPIRNTW